MQFFHLHGQRLDDVIAHAERLNEQNRVIGNGPNGQNGWLGAEESALRTGKVQVTKLRGGVKNFSGKIANLSNEVFCPSYFARDMMNRILPELADPVLAGSQGRPRHGFCGGVTF